MADKIKKAYQSTTSIYDAIMTQSSFIGRLYMKLFWGGVDDNEIAEKLLAYIPKDFVGTILDVPVGTAVFTYQKWRTLSSAQIFCIDYSEEMLLQAEQRLHGCAHITCMQGDVGNLPFAAGAMVKARRKTACLFLYQGEIRHIRLVGEDDIDCKRLVYTSFLYGAGSGNGIGGALCTDRAVYRRVYGLFCLHEIEQRGENTSLYFF